MSDLDNTRARLVAAAERLFIEGGEEATSLRAVTREAISNAAAVHYHFGGRDGLLRAVLNRHLEGRQARRMRLLDKASEQYGDNVPAQVVLTAIVRPDLELLGKLRKHRVQVARFLGRAAAHRSPVIGDYLERQFAEVVERVLPMLAATVTTDRDEVRQRLRLVFDGVAMLYATAPDPGQLGPLGTGDVDEQVRRLVAFAAAGVVAPTASPAASTTGARKRSKR